MPTQETVTIGKLAKLAGVGVETIRFYQGIGLLEEPPRPRSGYRHYPPAALERLRFIKRAQELSFSLKEIGLLLEPGGNRRPETRTLTTAKLEEVRARIEELVAARDTLEQLIAQYDSNPDTSRCPVISALSAKPDRA